MSPLSRSAARGLLLLACSLPLLGAAPAAATAPAVVRPVPPCVGDDAAHVAPHHRPLPPPGLIVGEPVRRAAPARPCL
ncbi:hypothetical protein [Streptomyces rubellomurinus]|uniref:Secreted protein n=2 Tax=Streptomyces TaxID=1883 RepID=A0A0F2T962_STRR3|nr:hypothetical protein [Streptomyces rubellomurinus]KJS59748.1 hypothetical protein VM95_25470 [Streptomyces rubellomurinus]